MQIEVTVNGHVFQREVEEHWTLLRFLRDGLGMTGSKEGCGAGECAGRTDRPGDAQVGRWAATQREAGRRPKPEFD